MPDNILKSWVFWVVAIYLGVTYWLYCKAKDAAHAAAGAVKDAGNKLIVEPVQNATVAIANVVGVNEAGGYKASDGQNDPVLQYNLARVAYATAKGYTPGSDEWLNPPGFPTLTEWMDNGGAVTKPTFFESIFGR